MSAKLDSWYLSDRTDWQTPQDFFDLLHAEFRFTIDAAATPENAMLRRFWTKQDNAPLQDWTGERVWCNPPYGREGWPFIEKAARRDADVAVLLVPARPDTRVWHRFIFPWASEIRWVRKRLRFRGAEHDAPFPSAVAVFDRNDIVVPANTDATRWHRTRTV